MSSHPFLEKAQEALAATRVLVEQGHLNSSANRAYYAAFHAARAALIAARLSSPTRKWGHDAIQGEFAKLIRRGSLKPYPSALREVLSRLLDAREIADYGLEMISLRVAKDSLRRAEEMVAHVQMEIGP